jgi:hypothetical protein
VIYDKPVNELEVQFVLQEQCLVRGNAGDLEELYLVKLGRSAGMPYLVK